MDNVTALFFAITALCVLASISLAFVKVSVSRARRIYWSCAVIAAVSAFFCGYPGVGRGIGAAAVVVFGMVLAATRGTPYLKVRGKIYAFNAADRRAADDDVPSTFDQDIAAVAGVLQRRFGDDDIPDTTGRNITEALNALRLRPGGDEAPANTQRDTAGTTDPFTEPPDRTPRAVRITVESTAGIPPRVADVLFGLPLIVGGALMSAYPPPPVRGPHTVTTVGVFCTALGIYLVVKAVRVRQTIDTTPQQPALTGSAEPHRHAANTSIRESAKLVALFVAMTALGAGMLWWGISAGLLSVVGMSIVLLGPTLMKVTIAGFTRLQTNR